MDENKIANAITITYEDTKYTLTYTRRSVQQMETGGFVFDEIDTKPALRMPQLFHGAFLAKAPLVKAAKIEDIYKCLPNKDKLMFELSKMYQNTLASLLDEPDEEHSGKATWEMAE